MTETCEMRDYEKPTITELWIKIDKICMRTDISARKLSLILGYNADYISHRISRNSLSLELLLDILEVFEISPAEFFAESFEKRLNRDLKFCEQIKNSVNSRLEENSK